MQMVQLECSRHPKPLCLIHFWSWENSLFSLLATLAWFNIEVSVIRAVDRRASMKTNIIYRTEVTQVELFYMQHELLVTKTCSNMDTLHNITVFEHGSDHA